jgi:hypothetical protein
MRPATSLAVCLFHHNETTCAVFCQSIRPPFFDKLPCQSYRSCRQRCPRSAFGNNHRNIESTNHRPIQAPGRL